MSEPFLIIEMPEFAEIDVIDLVNEGLTGPEESTGD